LIQNVGHELRTPLGLIKGYVELLVAGDLGELLESQRSALQVIRERTAILTRLIHNLTVLQTVPREALALAPVSVVEIVQGVLVEFERPAAEMDIAFETHLPAELPSALGDQERLALAFGHLIDNAVKFSPGGGTVTLRAWAGDGAVCVSVADEGIGIPPESLSRIFDRFYQVDGSARRRFGGMGIGLALVWEIVEAHEGTVIVESQVGKGSTFTVQLPQMGVF
jgi:signal transduction histidine kinase